MLNTSMTWVDLTITGKPIYMDYHGDEQIKPIVWWYLQKGKLNMNAIN